MMFRKFERENTVEGVFHFHSFMHFKNRPMLLMNAYFQEFIITNCAYYGLNLPTFLKSNVLQMKIQI